MLHRILPFLLVSFSIACALGPPAPTLEVSWEGGGRTASRVGAVVVHGIAGLDPDDVWLIRGKLNDKAILSLFERSPPDSVAERRVPAFVRVEKGELSVQPTVRLEAAEVYSIGVLGLGLLTAYETRPDSSPVFSRIGSAPLWRNAQAIYCILDGPVPQAGVLDGSDAREVERELPLGGTARVGRGVGSFRIFDDSCIQIAIPPNDLAFFLPPREAFGFELDPSPVPLTDSRGAAKPCGEDTCLAVGRLGIELTVVPNFGFLEGRAQSGETVRTFASGTRLRLSSLTPECDYELEAVFDVGGALFEEAVELRSSSGEALLVLNEVLANPSGPEPQSEWVEIGNAGSREASLAGYRLVDSGGETILPDVVLAPGSFGVVVRSDYRPDPRLDPVPPATAVPIVISAIGDGGLRNDGEALELQDPMGVVISRIPQLKANPGKSIARVELLAPDIPESFSSVAPTPGAPNGS